MLDQTDLKAILHTSGLSKTDRLLLCLAVNDRSPKQVKAIKALATAAGLSTAKKWNISQLLSSSRGLAIRVPKGWELTAPGMARVEQLLGTPSATPAPKAAQQLRAYGSSIKDPNVHAFTEEAILCLEHKHLRAAVVLSWVGAVSVLYNHITASHLGDFNAEAVRRDPKWRKAKSADDLAKMKESDFLGILEALSIIGKSVKGELAKCLQLRNGCGHPNSLAIGENAVAAHIEILILNVFSQFPG